MRGALMGGSVGAPLLPAHDAPLNATDPSKGIPRALKGDEAADDVLGKAKVLVKYSLVYILPEPLADPTGAATLPMGAAIQTGRPEATTAQRRWWRSRRALARRRH